AQDLGALALPEPPGTRGLNAALTAAISRLTAGGAGAVLIVQGDVPAIGWDDIAAMLEPAPQAPCVRAVPSAGGGASAPLLRPPGGPRPPARRPQRATHPRRAAPRRPARPPCPHPGHALKMERTTGDTGTRKVTAGPQAGVMLSAAKHLALLMSGRR